MHSINSSAKYCAEIPARQALMYSMMHRTSNVCRPNDFNWNAGTCSNCNKPLFFREYRHVLWRNVNDRRRMYLKTGCSRKVYWVQRRLCFGERRI